MSATPRADAQTVDAIGFYSCSTVPASLARELETENEELRRALRWFLNVYDSTRLGKSGLRPPKDGWTHFQTAAYIAGQSLAGATVAEKGGDK